MHIIDASANTIFLRRGLFCPRLAHAQNEYSCDTFDKLILASIDIIHRRPQNSWFYHKKNSSFMNVLHNFKWPLHGTSQFVRYMSSAQYPSFVWDLSFLEPVYLYGDRKFVCLRFSSFSWKGVPSTKDKHICGSVNLFIFLMWLYVV